MVPEGTVLAAVGILRARVLPVGDFPFPDTPVVAKKRFEKIARDHYDHLFRAALFLCGDRDVAEELVQDCFLVVAESLDKFEGRSSIYTWLYGILLNKFRVWMRRRGRALSLDQMAEQHEESSPAEFLEGNEDLPEGVVERRERAELVRQAIDDLPVHHRSVLALRYLEELSYEEIAEGLGCSLGTVKSRIHYALKRIARTLRAKVSDYER